SLIDTFNDEKKLRALSKVLFLSLDTASPKQVFELTSRFSNLLDKLSLPKKIKRKYKVKSRDYALIGIKLANRGYLQDALTAIAQLDTITDLQKERAFRQIAVEQSKKNIDDAFLVLSKLKTSEEIGKAIDTICEKRFAIEN